MRPKIKSVFIIIAIVYCAKAFSNTTVSCEDPQGYDLYHGPEIVGDGFKDDQASHSESFGSSPRFILPDNAPDQLLILWGGAVPDGLSDEQLEELDTDRGVERARIVHRRAVQITAVRVYRGGVEVISLYPEIGYGVYSTHGTWGSSQANANLYFGECNFSR